MVMQFFVVIIDILMKRQIIILSIFNAFFHEYLIVHPPKNSEVLLKTI